MKNKLLYSIIALSIAGTSVQAQSTRCHTMENLGRLILADPTIETRMQKIENQTQQLLAKSLGQGTEEVTSVINIPVVIHVVYSTAAQNISNAQIQSQIDVLNEDYRRLNSDKTNTPSAFTGSAADAEINFCIASTDPHGVATTGIIRKQTSVSSFSDDDAVKHSSTGGDDAWPSGSYLNIWVCNLGGGLLGYAQFPGGAASTDGVVIVYTGFGRGFGTVAPYDKGRSATHEVGHWLNLRHIWGDASCGNDLVNDTPTQQTSNFGCPSFPSVTCSNTPTGDEFMNYMDYTDDACMNMFSLGQKSRMKALFATGGARASLTSSIGCGGGSTQTLTAGVLISLSSGSNPGCLGTSETFHATPTNGGTTPSYQWKVGGVNVGTNSSNYSTTSLTNGQAVTCVMTSNLAGVIGNPAASNSITMTINSGAVTPSVAISISSGTNPSASDASVSFTATPSHGGTSPSYQWKVSGVNDGTNSPTFTTTTLTNGQTVTCLMTSSAACASPATVTSSAITMTITGSSYCTAGTTTTTYEHITNVTIGDIDNTSTNTSYSNYSSLSTNTTKGTAYTVTVSLGNPYATDKVIIWCDWNNNGVFTDAGENVFTSAAGVGPFNASITPPSSAMVGPVRMRIRLTDSGSGANLGPCGSSSYGEVEDYTLNVTATSFSSLTGINNPANCPELLSIYPNPSSGSFNIKAANQGDYYILDETGRLVQSFKLNADNNYSIFINDLSIGFYIVAGQNKLGVSKQKIVVTK